MEAPVEVEGATASADPEMQAAAQLPLANDEQASVQQVDLKSPYPRKRSIDSHLDLDSKENDQEEPQNGQSSARKKIKIDLTGVEHASDGLDEGEINSVSPSSNGDETPAQVDDEVDAGDSGLAPQPLQPPEPAKAQASLGWNGGTSSSGLRTSFGSSLSASLFKAKQPLHAMQADDTASPVQTEQEAGPSSATTPLENSPKLSAEELLSLPIPEEERKEMVRILEAAEEGKATYTIEKKGRTWRLPPFQSGAVVGNTWQEACDELLQNWLDLFLQVNTDNSRDVGANPRLMKLAFLKRVNKGLPNAPKNFRLVLEQRITSVEGFRALKKRHTSKPKNPGNQEHDEGNMKVVAVDMDLNEEQLMRQRYFPGVPDDAEFCLTCASYGHRAKDCPSKICKFCKNEHFSYACPLRARCNKCKQLGHDMTTCPEKLALAPDEAPMECAFCDGQDHTEESCQGVWQSYTPKFGSTKTVTALPVYCYSCGNQGHYGGDCGLSTAQYPPSETWTKLSLTRFVNSQSTEQAVVFKNQLPDADALHTIPGRSIVPNRHVVYESGDDDDLDEEGEGFIRARPTNIRRSDRLRIAPLNVRPPPLIQQQQQGPQAPSRTAKKRSRPKKGSTNPPLPPSPPPGAQLPMRPQAPSSQRRNRGGTNGQGRGGGNNGGFQPQQGQGQFAPGLPNQNANGSAPRGRGGFSNLGRGGGRNKRGRGH